MVGGAGVVTAGMLDKAKRRELHVERATLVVSTAERRRTRLAQALAEARRARDAALVAAGVVDRAEARLTKAETALRRAQLTLEEVRETGLRPRDDVTAPRVGERDFVAERLATDLEAVKARIALLVAERRRATELNETGFGTLENLATRIAVVGQRIALLRQAAEDMEDQAAAIAQKHGLIEGRLEHELASLRSLESRKTEIESELAVRKPVYDRVKKHLTEGEGDAGELAELVSSEKVRELEARRQELQGELAILMRSFGEMHAKVIETKRMIALIEQQIPKARRSALTDYTREHEDLVRRLEFLTVTLKSKRNEINEIAEAENERKVILLRVDRLRAQAEDAKERLRALEAQRTAYLHADRKVDPERQTRAWEDDVRGAVAEEEAREIERRLEIRRAFLAGEETAARAELRAERSRAVLRRDSAKLRAGAAREVLGRVKRLHSTGLSSKAEVRAAQAEADDLAAESKLAEIDIRILDERLAE
ncbi:MAG: coiled-coil domain-containing protein [Planctomycetota bacterium]|jgi:chromosome segregation ATPase